MPTIMKMFAEQYERKLSKLDPYQKHQVALLAIWRMMAPDHVRVEMDRIN